MSKKDCSLSNISFNNHLGCIEFVQFSLTQASSLPISMKTSIPQALIRTSLLTTEESIMDETEPILGEPQRQSSIDPSLISDEIIDHEENL